MSSFTTPIRNPNVLSSYSSSSKSFPTERAKAVDVVTGKAIVEYFFDPSLILDENTASATSAASFKTPSKRNSDAGDSIIFSSKHLFSPCTIVKSLSDDGGGGGTGSKKNKKKNKRKSTADLSGPALVKTSDGTLYKIQDAMQLIALTSPDDYIGISDVLHLANVSEASLLHTLRMRYKRDEIYTSAGPILISVNPYRPITISSSGGTTLAGESFYSESVMMRYRMSDNFSEEDPHLFQVADRAYRAMMDSVHTIPHLEDNDPDHVVNSPSKLGVAPGQVLNQSIIISGESGAGKTEATKYIMQYLARITKKKGRWSVHQEAPFLSPDGKAVAALEDRVLSSNPLLETFGNAQTLRNDNSSRFGKFIHINFSTDTGIIVGAQISNYLLEKTRITTQIEGERNYHIFYQLFSGSGPEQLLELGLDEGTSAFRYLGNRSFPKNEKDSADFSETLSCLSMVGLASEEQSVVVRMVAAVLHLGNISFMETESEDHSAVVSEGSRRSLRKACELLGLDDGVVSEAILTKLLNVNGKIIKKSSTVAMAEDKRDALAKMTYSCLFVWLVKSINRKLRQHECIKGYMGDNKTGFIGVLDIYGFECFDVNGYEQLLINYCNEKLQRHFNRHLFEVEQNLYSSEGVDWTYITFNDNRPCLELIEGGSGVVGILNTLDDSYAGMGSSGEKEVKFVAQLHKLFGSVAGAKLMNEGHESFITPKFGSDRQFSIVHYAGEVRYTADGFVEKNMESLSNELRDLGSTSTIAVARDVFGGASVSDDGQSRRSSIRGFSVASQFKQSLQSLVDDLEKTQPHYIRCIKPNLHKAPNSFSSGEVLKQLRYSGMMEAIRIRREGYALREDHLSFFNRFSVLIGAGEVDGGLDIEKLVDVLSARLNVSDADWQIGHSKIFLKRDLSDKLERLAKLRVRRAARTLGRFGRNASHRRASTLLVTWIKFRLSMLKIYRARRASSKIAAVYRMHTQVKSLSASINAVIKIQAHQRRVAGSLAARKLRDPFFDLSHKELNKLMKLEKALLEEAIRLKDFKKAAEMEQKIESIRAAVEQRQPMTRQRLEAQIKDLQTRLDDVIDRKDYKEAGPLQDKVESLTNLRKDYPTIDELKLAVTGAEAAVATAANNRDFENAASLQEKVNETKQRLDEAIQDEGCSEEESVTLQPDENTLNLYSIESRADLEREILTLHGSINESISTKDFKLASGFQLKVEELEKLRGFFPSMEDLQSDLRAAKDRLREAIAGKDFRKAEQLHDDVDRLEERIKSERVKAIGSPNSRSHGGNTLSVIGLDGIKMTFESRYALEDEIALKKSTQSEKVASKSFKEAQEIQALIDKLEELRAVLPTVVELEKSMNVKKNDMKRAISEKRFADAELIDLEINILQDKLSLEAKNATSPVKALKHNVPTVCDSVVPRSKTIASGVSVQSMPVAKCSVGPLKGNAATVVNGTQVQQSKGKTPSLKRGIEMKDDISDITSIHSWKSEKAKSKLNRTQTKAGGLEPHVEARMVSKLRPKKPLISSMNDSVLTVTQMLASKRGDAALVVGEDGSLSGIITDTDITIRLVARYLDASSTTLSQVMTPNPLCVLNSDSAMDAMTIMVENHFRHLPVVDEKGGVVGLLDIAKCLNDAISKLEKSQMSQEATTQEAVNQALKVQGTQGPQAAAALNALLGPLLSKAFGSQSSPTLRSLLAGKPSTIVSPETSLLEVGIKMAESRKAALVVQQGKLVGIFGFKDMMTRVIAKELSLEHTKISEVMTPNPEAVSPEMTVLEALQTMHDNKFLTLPVCEDDGTVVGLVNVMDVIYGCGGAEGWRSIFKTTMDLDDLSDDASAVSGLVSVTQGVKPIRSVKSATSLLKISQNIQSVRPVSKLRPNKPLISSINDSVLLVAQMLSCKRGAASLVVGDEGDLAGIVTDTDITRRLVARQLNPNSTSVAEIMTCNPTCVSMTDSAMDAMATMVENHFRHLPVVDEKGGVVGLLDIAKCLNDAISKLENWKAKPGNVAAQLALEKAVQAQGAKGTQAEALKALLGPLMTQAFGSQSSPTLRSLLAGKPSTIVSPETSLLEVGIKMAESRKAALVVQQGKLVGIFGFKDMMTRVIAKELSLEHTKISEVMTPNPEAVSPEMTVLEALQTMHDNKFLTLPVCEDDGTVVGLVNVMDVIYGCGGAEGWRSIFKTTMDLDDLSDDASAVSGLVSVTQGVKPIRSVKSATSLLKISQNIQSVRPVSKLRPNKPLISSINDSVLLVAQMLSCKRGAASLVVGDEGDLAGIVTDTDITRRLVARQLNPNSTSVAEIMTCNPTCVSMTDSAMDAMATMVENHFRHLPVVDEKGGVVGLLDIAKCLNDAISKLENWKAKPGNVAAQLALEKAVQAQGAKGTQAEALKALLGPLMTQAFGSQSSPTLRSLLAGKPSTIVSPETSLLEVGIKMAESRKAALVVQQGKLVGIFGFKDMMTRVIDKELSLEHTKISEVMTPNPEAVSPEMTVLEALQTMHDNKFLTLPVCEDDGTVVGLVNVMDVIYGCGGAEGWRSIFKTTMDLDDLSESASSALAGDSIFRVNLKPATTNKAMDKNVSMLRPKKALILSSDLSVLSVSQELASARGDAAILVDEAGHMAGIFTDTDVTNRVIAKNFDPATTSVGDVMTANPKYVDSNNSAMEAMMLMIEHRFRHLPVTSDGDVVGILDIARCLYDAISKLERVESTKPNPAQEIVKEALASVGSVDSVALNALLPLLSKAFGHDASVPTLRRILSGSASSIVSPETSVLEASIVMAGNRKAALVVENGELVGIFGFRDMMTRVVAKELDLRSTLVSEVMTPEPECVGPETTAVEALQIMHDSKFLTLPVCEENGDIVGLVDVMDIMHGFGDVEHWRSLFSAALGVDDPVDHASSEVSADTTPAPKRHVSVKISKSAQMVLSPTLAIPGNIPSTLEFQEGLNEDFDENTLNDTYRIENESFISDGNVVTFKIVDPNGNTHRVRSEVRILNLRNAFAGKASVGAKADGWRFKFYDEDGDAILISTDEDLAEAVAIARASNSSQVGKLAVKLAVEQAKSSKGDVDPMILAGLGITVVAVALGAMMLMMQRR